jgi:subtilisin family serine protease
MRKLLVPVLACLLAGALLAPSSGAVEEQVEGRDSEYVVLFRAGGEDAGRAAIAASGGAIVRENRAVGLVTVRTRNGSFARDVAAGGAVAGVARNRAIGHAPLVRAAGGAHARDAVEQEGRSTRRGGQASDGGKHRGDPLADLQWDMHQIRATGKGSYKVERGDKRVLVGIIDTGIDGTHPDIAPNFSERLSRNFTVDVPADANGVEIDGPCSEEPDGSCNDPANVDEDGHGTHVASTIGSPVNGIGVSGVAPNVTLVNLRAGQDSGYFFLQPSIDALTYAGDVGVDVVNMSYYVDPWLFNCATNPADSPEDQAEQRTIVAAIQRALRYAHDRGVTLIAAAGNEAIDYTKPSVDESSPDFADTPGEAPYPRTINPDDCLSMPSEGKHVIAVSSTGQSERKAYYSSFGLGYVQVAAPGGDVYDTPDGSFDVTGAVLAAYPKAVGVAIGDIDPATGEPTNEFVVRDCKGSTCAYYQYLQGTSMASPHAVGVAALIVSKYGHGSKHDFGLDPSKTRRILRSSADEKPCPAPSVVYARLVPQDDGSVLRVESAPHVCEGDGSNNGFYGRGIIDALAAVRGKR